MFDPEVFGKAMGDAIREAVAPLRAEIAALKKQLAERPDYEALIVKEVAKAAAGIRVPEDGKDCDMSVVKALVAEALEALPKPERGLDGRSVSLDEVRPLVDEAMKSVRQESNAAVERILTEGRHEREAMQKAVSALRQPEDGKSVTLADVEPLLKQAVQSIRSEASEALAEAIKAIPVPANGEDGKDGKDGAKGEDGKDGKDGIGLAGAMIDRAGELLVTMTNGAVKSLGAVVGKDGTNGTDGKNGADGISLDAFELDYLGESHEVRIKAACGGRTQEVRFPAGGLRPAGYWREGTKAKACEAWVHDGSLWIATKNTAGKPQAQSEDWVIAARKGRDGESIVKTIQAGPPAPIKLGA